MNCRRVKRLLSDHIDGLVSKRVDRAITAHLGACDACRHLRDEISAVRTEYRELAGRLTIPDSDIEHRAIARWAADRSHRRTPCATLIRKSPGTALAGALLLAVAGQLLVPWNRPDAKRLPGQTERSRPQPGLLPDRNIHGPASPPQIARDMGRNRPANPLRISPGTPRPDVRQIRSLAEPRRYRKTESTASAVGGPPAISAPDDLASLNRTPESAIRLWAMRARDERDETVEPGYQRVRAPDDFVAIPYPRLASISDRSILAAVESHEQEAAIVDDRLSRRVTLQLKATALSDLCDDLRSDTGIPLTAGRSVADEKVTLFCQKLTLRDVMRQLSRPFGYTWLRSGKRGEYRYELVQDLRSQLLEEELRNRERNAALLALDRETQRYRPYLGLSPDEALTRAETAAPNEKKLLEELAGGDSRGQLWAPLQIIARLSPQELSALRAGQKLTFSTTPRPGEQSLPPDIARGVLQTLRSSRVVKIGETYSDVFGEQKSDPRTIRLGAIPDVQVFVQVSILQSELGEFMLNGGVGWFTVGSNGEETGSGRTFNNYLEGMGHVVPRSAKEMTNARLTHDPALRRCITVRPQPSCTANLASGHASTRREVGTTPDARVTSADVLEALHRATDLPIIADYYTRLFPRVAVSVGNRTIWEALNQLADAMRMRWHKEGNWLQFRSASYFNDRLKEVPNRLLDRWAASRRQHGALTLDDLVEIAQLSDAQLDAKEMAEGARECFGLAEWSLASNGNLRRHLRFLSAFTPAQRQEAMSDSGLPFDRMTLAQQQRFLISLLKPEDTPLASAEELAGATLKVEYRGLELGFHYIPGAASRRPVHWVNAQNEAYVSP
jgi:Putative zinc-finger